LNTCTKKQKILNQNINKENMKKLLLCLAILLALTGCDDRKKFHRVMSAETIHCKTVHRDDGSDYYLYWYLMSTNSGSSSYYYYASPTQVDNFTSTGWVSSNTEPQPAGGGTVTEESQEVSQVSEVVDQEGNTQAAEDAETGANGSWEYNNNTNEADNNTADNSNDAGGSDGGSDGGGDDGGGDAGGGDGGGGGGD
jgi:uncharacterized membrane protein YgcG